DARAGRLRLPLDELEASQATCAQLAQPPWPGSLAALVRERHGQLRSALESSATAFPPGARAPLRGLIVWAAIASGHSARAERRRRDDGWGRVSQRLADGWRAWRAARRAAPGGSLAVLHRV